MDNYYPPVGFYFKVTFNGDNFGGETSFKEISGLTSEMTYEEVTEGGELRFRHQLPTGLRYQNITLKRGLVIDSGIRTWIEKCFNEFVFETVMVSIELLNEQGDPSMSWVVYNARPVKWEVSSFESTSNEIVLETLELTFDYFETKT